MLSSVIHQFYGSVSNPFVYALKFFANACDHANPKSNSFAYSILEELQLFKRKFLSPDEVSRMIDDNIKVVAFNFLKRCGQITTFRLAVDIFELIESKKLFVEEIHELITTKHFKEAGQISCDLQLYHEFEMEDFLIPLLLQDKLGIFEDYLDKAINLREPTIQILDSFLSRESTVRAICDEYIAKYELQDIKYDKLHKKPISKLLNRLLRKYQLSDKIAPNMKKQKEFGSLFFIIRKYYDERSLNQASFDEMVKDTIGNQNKELQIELVHSCLSYGSLEDAVKWAKYYDISCEDLPNQVKGAIENSKEFSCNESLLSANIIDEDVHTLSLHESCILMVNDVQNYHAMINDLKNAKIIAFDTEWKPTILSCSDVSLIQLAKRDRIYLLDVITLIQHSLTENEWSLLGKCIFNNEEILKLGFAHTTDISMLVKFQPFGIQHNHNVSHSYLDLQGLWQKVVVNFPDFKFPYHEVEPTSQSLSNLVKLCLGKKLDKSNQFSNWQQRPLRVEQMHYAALDAYCLFEIFDVIGEVITKMGINYEQLINNVLTENKKDIISLTRSKKIVQNKNKQSLDPAKMASRETVTHVNGIKFVTDYMIGGIGRVLRQMGIDTIILKGDYVDHDECIRISQNEDRIILTASKPLFHRYQKYTKMGYAYVVEKSHNDIEGLEEIIRRFKININRRDVFSRCMVCNCNEFVIASKIDMIKMKYFNRQPPNELVVPFLTTPEIYSHASISEYKSFKTWRRYCEGERETKFGSRINFSSIGDGTLRVFQTFYICEFCSKVYWDGSHYNNSGVRFEHLFNLFN